MTGPDPTGVPMDGPTDPVRVWAWLNPESTTDPPPALVDVVAGTNAKVRRWVSVVPAAGNDWPADIVLGATMLAGRLYRRRATPTGVDTASLESAVYVRRNDPDIALLLGIGSYAPPVVG